MSIPSDSERFRFRFRFGSTKRMTTDDSMQRSDLGFLNNVSAFPPSLQEAIIIPKPQPLFPAVRFSTVTTPYLLLGSDVVGDSPCGGKLVDFNLYDPKTQEQVKIENKTLPKELNESKWIGSSRGWLASMNKNDSTVHLSSSSKKKTISLPPLTRDKFEHLVNVSVSSDCEAVAVKFYGSRVSLCRLGDSEWTRVDVPCPSFHSSTIIYSERDQRFYLNNCNPDYTGPTDFTPRSNPGLLTPVISGYKRFPFSNFLDEMPELEKETCLSRYKIQQQLVQSSSGQSFIVCW
ncbi:hypothetical protein Rs2_49307 [Raphanus sativus]|nr:hypothetical protein Rs2_49307 [Raphanus sativus]